VDRGTAADRTRGLPAATTSLRSQARRRRLAGRPDSALDIPHDPRFIRTLPIVPADVWAKDLTLSQENIRDFRAFAHWLEHVLKDQRQPAVTDDLATE